jgi:hypothetical protein
VNHYHADVLRHHLDGVLSFSTTVAVVTNQSKFTLTDISGFLIGDLIDVTVGGVAVERRILEINGTQIIVSHAIPGVAPGDAVSFSLSPAYNIYNYKDIASGEQPTFVRPCLVVTLPKQQATRGIPQGWHPETAIVDQTRVTLYLETPTTIRSGTDIEGGFDKLHHPAIRHLRAFLRGRQGLDIPAPLADLWRSGTVGMRPDTPDETYGRLPEAEQHLFHVVLYDFVTLTGG